LPTPPLGLAIAIIMLREEYAWNPNVDKLVIWLTSHPVYRLADREVRRSADRLVTESTSLLGKAWTVHRAALSKSSRITRRGLLLNGQIWHRKRNYSKAIPRKVSKKSLRITQFLPSRISASSSAGQLERLLLRRDCQTSWRETETCVRNCRCAR
jgi:hypothetical protein